ncbi:hypothetical protein BJP40_19165 [Streptomyces sp. CC53]|nr:hypothetical protein BJP40_19165 [Streptomyces sp. CC53]
MLFEGQIGLFNMMANTLISRLRVPALYATRSDNTCTCSAVSSPVGMGEGEIGEAQVDPLVEVMNRGRGLRVQTVEGQLVFVLGGLRFRVRAGGDRAVRLALVVGLGRVVPELVVLRGHAGGGSHARGGLLGGRLLGQGLA